MTAIAEVYASSGEWEAARKQLETALAADPANPRALHLLGEVAKKQHEEDLKKQWTLVRDADARWRDGDFEKARETARKAAEHADPQVLAKVREILDRNKPAHLVADLASRFKWLPDLITAIVAVLCLSVILRFARGVYTSIFRWREPQRLVLRSFQDSTSTGAGDLSWSAILRFRSARPEKSQVAGLLNVQPSRTPGQIVRFQPAFAASPLPLKELDLKIGTFYVAGIGRFLDALAEWFGAQLPAVTGSADAFSSDTTVIIVRLTYTDRKRAKMKATVTATATGPDGARSASESAGFQMYYLLSHPEAPESTALAHDRVRQGLAHLREYAAGFTGTALEEALKDFSYARALPESPNAALLYEGVTLDLMERHEDAIARFRLLAQQAPDGPEHDTAVYNEATAHFRRYRPDALIAAESLYSSLVGRQFDVLKEPIRELAKVGLANVYAHKPIFWQALLHDGRKAVDETEAAAWWRGDFKDVFGWGDRVLALVAETEKDLQLIVSPANSNGAWDEMAIQQLRWGRWNALGNVFLYLAINFLSEAPPHIADEELSQLESLRRQYLELSLAALGETERIGVPGVETLTNVGTLLLNLGRFDEARRYFRRAIDINPDYEYAYFRTAEAWVKEGDMEAAKGYLASYGGMPRITHFRKLFAECGVPIRQ